MTIEEVKAIFDQLTDAEKAMVCDFARDLVQKRPPNPAPDL